MARNNNTRQTLRWTQPGMGLLDYAPSVRRQGIMNDLLAKGFPYSRRLTAHSSCVNALAFSNGDGQYLVSGGDDLHIQLWDFHQEDILAPSGSFVGPQRNIFNLAFSASNRYLYSGGADDLIMKYDLNYGGTPKRFAQTPQKCYIGEHDASVRGLSPHPANDEIYLSAGEDGRIILHDERESPSYRTRAQRTIQVEREVTGVQYHPFMDHIFATSDSQGGVHLRDARMAFGPAKARTREGVVLSYTTRIIKPSGQMANPEASSICFDRSGTKLAVTFLHYLPTIFSLSDPLPAATCGGRSPANNSLKHPSSETYSNSCTMKHGSFGGPGIDLDSYYAAGSDDFRGYIWRVPSLTELSNQRESFSPDEWAGVENGSIGFCENQLAPRYVPVNLSEPHCRLTGHRSIVNNIVMHPQLPYAASSGIEMHVMLHSASRTSTSTHSLQETPKTVRSVDVGDDRGPTDRLLFHLALHGLSRRDEDVDSSPESQTIAMFDHIVREERGTDPFEVRSWSGDDDESSADEDEEEDEDMSLETDDESKES